MNLKDYQSMSPEEQVAYANERLSKLKLDGKKTADYDEAYAEEGLKYSQIYKVLHKAGHRMDKALMQFVPRYAEQTEAAATTVEQQQQEEENVVVAPEKVALTESEIIKLKLLLERANPMSFEEHIKANLNQKFGATTVRVRENVLADWNEFCKSEYGYYNQSDVLTAALAEFMAKYGSDE